MLSPTTTEVIRLSDGSIEVPMCRLVLRPWRGLPLADTYGGKPIIEMDGEACFAELAILRLLQRSGWDGVWVDSYGRHFRNAPPGVAGHASPEVAEQHFRAALRLATDRGMQPLIAHCHLGLGKLYRRTGDGAKVQEHLTTAATMYREMGMNFWLEKAEAALGPPHTNSP